MMHSAEHARSTMREIERDGLIAAAILDPVTNTLPLYRADGSLWFILDATTGREVKPVYHEEEVDGLEIAGVLHGLADKSTTHARCYFIGGAEGLIKIGYSVAPGDRLKALQSGCPIELEIFATAPGGVEREAAYHAQFSEHRVRGEWFERSPEILAEIERLKGEAG